MIDYYDLEYGGYNSPDPNDGCLGSLLWAAAIISLLALCMLFSSCKTREVVVERVTHDTTYVAKNTRDSVYFRDSVYVREWTKADTVYITTTKWQTRFREKEVHDTIIKATTDSIPYPVPVKEYVEKDYSWWDKTRFYLCYIFLALLLWRYRKKIFSLISP